MGRTGAFFIWVVHARVSLASTERRHNLCRCLRIIAFSSATVQVLRRVLKFWKAECPWMYLRARGRHFPMLWRIALALKTVCTGGVRRSRAPVFLYTPFTNCPQRILNRRGVRSASPIVHWSGGRRTPRLRTARWCAINARGADCGTTFVLGSNRRSRQWLRMGPPDSSC